MFPGTYPQKLSSREIEHELLNVVRRTYHLKKEASSFLLSVPSRDRVCVDWSLSRAFGHMSPLIGTVFVDCAPWSQNIKSLPHQHICCILPSSTVSITIVCEMWLLFFLTEAESHFLVLKFYFLTTLRMRKLKLREGQHTHVHMDLNWRVRTRTQVCLTASLMLWAAVLFCLLRSWQKSWGPTWAEAPPGQQSGYVSMWEPTFWIQSFGKQSILNRLLLFPSLFLYLERALEI